MTATCGTRNGYVRHRRNKEDACDACKQAQNAYSRGLYASDSEYRAKKLASSNARQRALVRLAKELPDRYSQLYGEELGS